jgi:hypothetical protein
MISGVFALIFGGRFAFGGLPELSAAVVFGLWFLTCLVLAVGAIRRDDIVHHRRWMIGAFGIGTVRIWLGLSPLAGLDFASSFGPAFGSRSACMCWCRTLAAGLFRIRASLPASRGIDAEVRTSDVLRTTLGSDGHFARRS